MVARECPLRRKNTNKGVVGRRGDCMKELVRRFWLKVNKQGPLHPVLKTRCWLWTGALDAGNYGRFKFEGKNRYAHRVGWFLTYGKWPKLKLLHRCDNPACVRPTHEFEGTQTDNMADCMRKGRWPVRAGEANGRARLTAKQVVKIRARLRCPYRGLKAELARAFGISYRRILAIETGSSWKQVN